MTADRLPWEPPSDRERERVRDAIERKKTTENARDAASHPKPASDDVSVAL